MAANIVDAGADSTLPSGATKLDANGIQKQIVGNTLAGSKWEEFYAPNGTINGLWKGRRYDAKWDTDGNKMCFHYLSPPADRCKTIAVNGNQVYFILDSGEVDEYSPAILKAGNPDGLGQ